MFIREDELDKCGAQAFIFGSALSVGSGVCDLDLLIIYNDETDLTLVKRSFESVSKLIPLHVTYMHETEEAEFSFIQYQKAKPVSEVWPNKLL